MAKKYLDETGLAYFWQKIKANVVTSVNGQTGDVIVGGGGGFSPVQLWNNDYASNNFISQIVSITTDTNWTLLMIIFGLQASNNSIVATWLVPSGYTTRASIAWMGSNDNMVASRGVSFSYSNGILSVDFADGYIKKAGTATAGSQYMIPLKIYGLA